MSCEEHIVNGIASTDYVDCFVSAVSGTLQEQIENIIPGVWEVLSEGSFSSLDKNSVITFSDLPERDILKIFIFNKEFTSNPNFVHWVMGFNNDFSSNYGTSSYGHLLLTLRSDRNLSSGSEITVHNFSSSKKVVSLVGGSFDSLGNNFSSTNDLKGIWTNTSDRINRIDFKFTHGSAITSASGANFYVRILGMNFS